MKTLATLLALASLPTLASASDSYDLYANDHTVPASLRELPTEAATAARLIAHADLIIGIGPVRCGQLGQFIAEDNHTERWGYPALSRWHFVHANGQTEASLTPDSLALACWKQRLRRDLAIVVIDGDSYGSAGERDADAQRGADMLRAVGVKRIVTVQARPLNKRGTSDLGLPKPQRPVFNSYDDEDWIRGQYTPERDLRILSDSATDFDLSNQFYIDMRPQPPQWYFRRASRPTWDYPLEI